MKNRKTLFCYSIGNMGYCDIQVKTSLTRKIIFMVIKL